MHLGKVRKSWPNVLGSIAANLIGEPQAVHCGPWFCVSSMVAPSVRGPEFPGKPPYINRLHRVAGNGVVLYGVALRAFEPAMLKPHGGPGLMRVSIIREMQREQCGRSMRVSDGPQDK